MKKISLIAFSVFSAMMVHAQSSSSVSQTVTLNLVNSINISIVSATGTNFMFDNVSKYENGLTNLNASTFLVQSNRPWTGTIKTATANFSGPANSPAMPSTVLGARISGFNAPFNALTTTALTYGSADRGTFMASVDYNVNPGFNYDAGTYTISVIYTATQQ